MATYIISVFSYGTETDRFAINAKNLSMVKECLMDKGIMNEDWDVTAEAHEDEDIDAIIIYNYGDADIAMDDVDDIDLSDDYEVMRISTVEEHDEGD